MAISFVSTRPSFTEVVLYIPMWEIVLVHMKWNHFVLVFSTYTLALSDGTSCAGDD